jgi:hypothetical protein
MGGESGLDVIHESPALPNFIEEPARESSAENVIDDVECLAIRMSPRQRTTADHQMRLLGVIDEEPVLTHRRRCRPYRLSATAASVAKDALGLFNDLIGVDSSGHGEHHALSGVFIPVETGDLVDGQRRDRLTPPTRITPERMPGEHRLVKFPMSDVVGDIVIHGEFFEDDPSLTLHILGPQRRPQHHLTEEVDRVERVPRRHSAVVGRVLAGGVRIDVAAYSVDTARDSPGVESMASLEEEMLQEVTHPCKIRRFITRADAHPHANGHRPGGRHRVNRDGQAVGKCGDAFGQLRSAMPATAAVATAVTAATTLTTRAKIAQLASEFSIEGLVETDRLDCVR